MITHLLRATGRPSLLIAASALAFLAASSCSTTGNMSPPDQSSSGPVVPEEDPNKHELGDARAGKEVFRSETFGNEAFWTDAVRLPQVVMAAKFTPLDALKAGYHVNVDALDAPRRRPWRPS